MKTIERCIEEWKVKILPQDADDWKLVCKEVAKEYAKIVAVEYGKMLGLRGTSYRSTPDGEQWEWVDKAGELNYDSTEALYDMFMSNDPKYRI
jgi:hypothetical protein